MGRWLNNGGLLEGSQPINEIIYPKQISSFPVKQNWEYILEIELEFLWDNQ
jgi:hypothetical protein